MDKTIVTSPEKRNDTSSFGGLDASHIDSAVRALRRSCLLYTSPSPRDGLLSRMPSSA